LVVLLFFGGVFLPAGLDLFVTLTGSFAKDLAVYGV